MSQSCGTCMHLDVEPDARGRFIVRRLDCYQCKAPAPEMPALPASVTEAHGFAWPPARRWVCGDDGALCPVYVRREASR